MKVLRPRTFDDALAMKADAPHAVPLAGGTDLLVYWPTNLDAHAETYIDLSPLGDVRHITCTDDTVTVGAGTTYWDVLNDATCAEELPILLDAAREVGAVQIQTRGTWAGNIANGSPAADGVPVLMAYDAEVELASTRGVRRVMLDAFYTGYRATVVAPDELIRAVHIPRRPYAFAGFLKIGSRRAQTITKTGVAITASDDGWRVVANSMAPTVRRCPVVEARLASGFSAVSPETLADAVDADLDPIDDLRSTAAYRRGVFARLVCAMIETAGPRPD